MKLGLGFIIISNPVNIFLAGSLGLKIDSPIKAEMTAIKLALQQCQNHGWIPDNIYCDCPGLAQILKDYNHCIAWHLIDDIQILK